MKKNFAKLASLFLALLTILAAVLPAATVSAATADGPTDVVITKVELEDLTGWPKGGGDDVYDGTQLKNFGEYFGAGAKRLEGVAFRVYQGSDATGTEVAGGPFLTNANGEVRIPSLPNGTYYFVEDKAASTYVGPNGEVLNEAAAVPFTLTLPMAKADGTGYFGTGDEALYVYPKNTVEKPEIEKDITGSTTPGQTHDYTVGESVPFTVTTKIPAKSEYKTLTWGDTMTEGLTFNQDVAISGIAGLTAADYTLTQTDRGFTLKFNEAGLAKLKTAAAAGEVTITLVYSATLNGDAVVDTPEKNHVTLKYGNSPEAGNTPVIVKPENGQIVLTKTWAEGTAPAGASAVFEVQNAQTGELVQTVTLNAANNWTTTITGLDNDTEYRVVEKHISGYAPEYTTTGDGNVTVKNVKDNNPGPLEPETPQVITYGKKFKKVDQTTGAALANAQFVVEQNGQYLALKTEGESQTDLAAYQAAEKAYLDAVKAATTAEPNAAQIAQLKAARDEAYAKLKNLYTWVAAQADALVFVSGPNGEFEVTGLKKGTYNLVETKAPAGYALLTAPVPFTVDAGTYTTIQDVNNKKVTIPETGGIGTVIFTAAGLLLMVGAVIAFRRNEQEA